MSTAKEELSRLIQGQPDGSSREEIVRELAFHVMVGRGLADSDAKRTIANEEMGRRIRTWQKKLGRRKRNVGSRTFSSTSRRIALPLPRALFKEFSPELRT